MLYERVRLDRACNIVIKGVNEQIGTIEKNKNEEGQNDFNGWAEKFLTMKLGFRTHNSLSTIRGCIHRFLRPPPDSQIRFQIHFSSSR